MRTFLVTADYNDADYVSGVVTITDEEFEKFLPVIEAIANFKPYVDAFGVNDCNWDAIRYDMGGKHPYEIYSQFPRELIEEFEDAFLSIHDPEGFGFHTIVSIQEVVLGKKYVDGSFKARRDDWDKLNKEIYDKLPDYHSYKRASDGKPINSIPFSKMTEEEMKILEHELNLWLDYRPDLNREEWYRKVTNEGYDFPVKHK